MNPTISFEIARASKSATVESVEFVEAEFVPKQETSFARRKPSAGKISMPLENWLSVDQKLHELYNLCEVAIMQRDNARELVTNNNHRNEKLEKQLQQLGLMKELLETRLTCAQAEIFRMKQKASRLGDAAEEAVNLPIFGGKKRKKVLKTRIEVLKNNL